MGVLLYNIPKVYIKPNHSVNTQQKRLSYDLNIYIQFDVVNNNNNIKLFATTYLLLRKQGHSKSHKDHEPPFCLILNFPIL